MGALNAVQSLHGNGGKAGREQEVWTPPWILDAAREALGGEICLDPCAASRPEGLYATDNYQLPLDGLSLPWLDGTFVNPPFDSLRGWLEKAGMEARENNLRIVALFPWRPHRRWLWPPLQDSEIVFLHYAVKFVGHKSAFPAPLVLVSWNCRIPDLGARETARIPR